MSTRAKEIVAAVRDELEKNADEKTRESAHRFFKEEVRFHGVRTAAVVKIAKQYFEEVRTLGKKRVFSLCEELLKTGYSEESWVAANWTYWMQDDFEPADFEGLSKLG